MSPYRRAGGDLPMQQIPEKLRRQLVGELTCRADRYQELAEKSNHPRTRLIMAAKANTAANIAHMITDWGRP